MDREKLKYARLKSVRSRKDLSPTSTIRARRIALEETIHAEILSDMKRIFEQADVDGGGFIDIEEFVDAFLGILSTDDGADDGALRKLFMRVDVNSDGVIDWNEFVSYMLLEKKSSTANKASESRKLSSIPIECSVVEKQAHRGLITSLTKLPPSIGDFYLSMGQDGSLLLWKTSDLTHEKTLRVGSCWITAAVFMPVCRKLAIADFSRAIKIYDGAGFQVAGSVQDLPYAPLCLTAWTSPKYRDIDFICLGDVAGNVLLYEVQCLPNDNKSKDRFQHKLRWSRKLHKDMVTSVIYVEEMNSVVSTSTDASLAISDAENRGSVKRLLGHTRSVNDCDWSSFYKFVCSGGQDRVVILWNPFSLKPLASLIGHAAPIVAITVYNVGNQLISLSTDKCTKLWDIRNHSCLQTLSDKERYFPEDTLSAMFFDAERQRLICGNRKIKGWDFEIHRRSQNPYHEGEIVALLYNASFDEAVSGDIKGNLCVWNLRTRKLRARFAQIHGEQLLTAMALDGNDRRLLTTTDNGICYMWNFSNGCCLKRFIPMDGLEISDVVSFKANGRIKLVTAGWDKKLSVFDDDVVHKRLSPVASYSGHTADIVCIAAATGANLMASGDIDGWILIWNTESWAIKKRLKTPSAAPLLKIAFLNSKWKHVIAALHEEGRLNVWHGFDGSLLATHWFASAPTALVIHPVTNALAIGFNDGRIEITKIAEQGGNWTLESLKTWSLNRSPICSLAWMPHRQKILIANRNLNIMICSLEEEHLESLCSTPSGTPRQDTTIDSNSCGLQETVDPFTESRNEARSESETEEEEDDIPISLRLRSYKQIAS